MDRQPAAKSHYLNRRFLKGALLLFGVLVPMVAYFQQTPAQSKDEKPEKAAKADSTKATVVAWNGKAEYVGDDICKGCHGEVGDKWQKTRHGQALTHAGLSKEARTCETCHGPGSEHANDDSHKKIYNPASLPAKDVVKRCQPCHASTVKPLEWAASGHGGNEVACNKCHDLHNPTKTAHLLKQEPPTGCLSCHKKQNAEFRRNSHHPVLEGRLNCTDCHNPHKPMGIGKNLKATGENLCLKCHPNRKGPFIVEHDPLVSGLTESCQACHLPHGSPNLKLTKLFGRGLCLQCHTNRVNHQMGQTCWQIGCHSEMHGGNKRLFFR